MTHLPLLLQIRWLAFRNSFHRLRQKSQSQFFVLLLFFAGTGAGLFFFFFHSFRFFESQEPFGPILLDETFYLLNFTLFLMLFISTAISSYASLFKSPEVPFLITRPVTWPEVYFLKLAEALLYSSWALLFITIPFMSAYGIVKETKLIVFPFLCFLFYIPFVLLAGMLGTLVGTLTVWLLPGSSHRRIAITLGILAAIFLLIRVEPEIVKEQGSIAGVMSGYLPHVAFAKSPLLPSYWTTKGILALSHIQSQKTFVGQEGLFYFLLLLSNTLFFLIPSYSVAGKLYPRTFLKAQDFSESGAKRHLHTNAVAVTWYDRLPWPTRPAMAFLEKDLKSFARDPAEWSQLIIFFGLLLLYFVNLRNLQFHFLQDFWKNLVFVLNTVGTYIVLSSFNMRFVFPMLSLEGSKFWMISLAPIRYSTLLLEKFLLGTIVSVLLTLPLVFLSGWMLEISLKRVLFTTGLGFFVCVALTGLSVGFGAKFPNFKSNHPAEIISGFGGSMLLVTHLLYLGLIGGFLAFSHQSHGLIFLTMAAGSLFVGTLPLHMGAKALGRMEF